MSINELLAAPCSPEVGRALMAWAKELPGRILRGDMMLGILSIDEVSLAPKALRKARDCGIQEALLDLGNWLARPPFGNADLNGAREAFREAIAEAVPNAKLKFIEFLWFHRRDTANLEEQREAYLMAEDLSKPAACNSRVLYLLGLMTYQGFGTRSDPARACELQKAAEAMGSPDASFELFVYHETGVGTPKDSNLAMQHLRRAADAGHARGMYNLAAYLATGRGVPKDLVKAIEWYSRSSEAGNVRATANLATMYASGEGVEKDTDKARLLFDEAEYMGLDVNEARKQAGL